MSKFRNQHTQHSDFNSVRKEQHRIHSENACVHCGRDRYRNPCNSCKIQDLEDFKKIREYVSKYPHSNPIEVASAVNIRVSVITRLMREGFIRSNYEEVEESGKKNTVYRNHFSSWE